MKPFPIPLLFLLWVSFFSFLSAQNLPPQDLIRQFADTTEGGINPRQIINVQGGGFLIAGSTGSKGLLTKLSPCGEVVWNQEYLYGAETALNGLTELPSGKLLAVGDCLACAPGDSTTKALVIKTDARGMILQDTTFGYNNFNATATAVINTADGRAAVTGSLVWARFLSPTRAFFTILDDQFQSSVWEEYNQLYLDKPQAITQTSDNGFLLAGYAIPALFAPRQAQLFYVDEQGRLLWKNTSTHLNSQFNSVQQAPDGKIIAFGQRLLDTLSGQDVYLAVHDPVNGDLLLDKTYGSPAKDFGRSLHAVEDGYLAAGIWGEPQRPTFSRRDWVFRLDENFEIEENFFRDSYLFAHTLVNVLPLSPDGKNFAFLSRLAFFASRATFFFKKTRQGRHLQLAEAPQHKRLYPRNLDTNKGMVRYLGSLSTPDTYEEIRLEVFRENERIQTLTDLTPADFSFQIDVPAELANYSFQLSGVKNGTAYLEAEACEVAAGDAYLIQGQSNALAGIPYDPENRIDHAYRYHRDPFIRNFGLKHRNDSIYVWHKEANDFDNYADKRSGQWGLIFGKRIVEEQGVPVAILNGAISGVSIDSMTDRNNPAGRYNRFLKRVDRSGLKNNLRALVMFQGETNAAGGFWNSADSYYQKFLRLNEHWEEDFPSLQQRYLFQIRPGAYWAGATLLTCLQIEEAQRRLAEDLPEWQVMSTTGMNHDSTHYFYQNGYERAGADIYRLMAHDLYETSQTLNIYPPTVDSAWFSSCDRQEITLQLRHSKDFYYWTPGWETDFRLEGSPEIGVDSGGVVGNTITLYLSGKPGPDFSGLSYTSHPGGSDAPVKNANGIGMLTFYNFQVGPPLPLLDTVSASTCAGEEYLLPDGVLVNEAGIYTSFLSSTEGCDSIVQTLLTFHPAPVLSDTIITGDDGSGNGSISLKFTEGASLFTYEWSTGDNTPEIENLSAGVYSLTITDADACSHTFEFEVPIVTALSEATTDFSIKIYPNPFHDHFFLALGRQSISNETRFELFDVNGRIVETKWLRNDNTWQLDAAKIPSGVYFIRITEMGQLLRTARVIKY